MPSNNSKYTEEFREQTAKMVIETGKSATSTAEEMGIDTNTVCKWVRDYRRRHGLPSNAEEKGLVAKPPKDSSELKQRIKELEIKIKEKDKIITEQEKRIRIEQEKEDIKLVTEIFESSDRIWGYRNIYKEIRSRGLKMSEYRIRKIMRENGLYPELAVKFKPQRNGKADGRYYKNIVEQQFKVKEKNRLRAGDITYLKTGTG